ncbi:MULTISPECIES: IS30 family transposase [unclassified Crossiella]|uniref:IS30 family transposase n=1 Tax=unclassified Crossiella TaxID=2620835 RepID=UPI0027E54CB6|nr:MULTISPECIES: IS30 family transposase [unclassified Crossiella]
MTFPIRPDRTPHGCAPLLAERAEYFRLVNLGHSNRQACHHIGIHPSTGNRWRNGRSPSCGRPALPPVPDPTPPATNPDGPSRYLTLPERLHIADLLRQDTPSPQIATTLGRHRTTITREITRNRDPHTHNYQPYRAHDRALQRLPRPKPGKIATHPELRALIQAGLDEQWSPQQISQTLHRDFPDRPEMQVCHETLYQALYCQGRGELRRELTRALRTGRARRRPHSTGRTPRFTDMVMISDRPADIEDRAVPGHWEGDLILGKNSASAIATLVERHTRYILLAHLPQGRDAISVRDALLTVMATLPAQLTQSLTWDQGAEMARHHEFTLASDIPVYFCDPGSPWQRGSNENTNGLLRQYFPKGTDLSVHTAEDLALIAQRLNRRPRMTLGWDSPAQRMHTLLTKHR